MLPQPVSQENGASDGVRPRIYSNGTTNDADSNGKTPGGTPEKESSSANGKTPGGTPEKESSSDDQNKDKKDQGDDKDQDTNRNMIDGTN